MNRPCLYCGSTGNAEPGTSQPAVVCRLCGRAWMYLGPSEPALAWWLVWDGDVLLWSLYEADLDSRVMMEVAAAPERRIILDLLGVFIELIEEKGRGVRVQEHGA